MKRPFDFWYIFEAILDLLPYLVSTFMMLILSILGGTILGSILAWIKIRRRPLSTGFANFYIYIIRACPPIVLLFLVFYGLPEILLRGFGIDTNHFSQLFFVVITFSLLFSATMAEVIRSAVAAIDKGQREAALSIGLSDRQAFIRIILPQATIIALPNFANSLIVLLKEGALAYTIGFIDVMGKGILMIGNQYGAHALEIYIALGLLYWSITIFLEQVFQKMEMKFAPDKVYRVEKRSEKERRKHEF